MGVFTSGFFTTIAELPAAARARRVVVNMDPDTMIEMRVWLDELQSSARGTVSFINVDIHMRTSSAFPRGLRYAIKLLPLLTNSGKSYRVALML